MPNNDTKALLVGAAVGTAAGSAAGFLSDKSSKSKPRISSTLERQRSRAASKRANWRQPPPPKHPGRVYAERELDTNPKEFRKANRAKRLARRAERARMRGKGLGKVVGKKVPGIGLAVNLPSTIGSASRITKEGGSFKARLGKFVEEMTGMPRGSAGGGLTESEKKSALQI